MCIYCCIVERVYEVFRAVKEAVYTFLKGQLIVSLTKK